VGGIQGLEGGGKRKEDQKEKKWTREKNRKAIPPLWGGNHYFRRIEGQDRNMRENLGQGTKGPKKKESESWKGGVSSLCNKMQTGERGSITGVISKERKTGKQEMVEAIQIKKIRLW